MSTTTELDPPGAQPPNITTNNNTNAAAAPTTTTTTAVSLWFGKAQSKTQHRRYGVVAAWSYKASTKQFYHAPLWRDQGPAPYLSTLSSWILGQQPETVYVSCAGGTLEALDEDKNLCLWMQDVEDDLRKQQEQEQQETTTQLPSSSAAAVQNLTRVVPSAVPAQIHQDGVNVMRALVPPDDAATLYQLKANPDLTPTTATSNSQATPLLCAAAVLLQAVGLYQPTLGVAVPSILAGNELQDDNHGDNDNHNNHNYAANPTKFTIQPMPSSNFLVLDRAAASSLNVWPIAHAGQAAMEGATAWHASLYGLLCHHARTRMGKAQLQQWLLHPLIELSPLLERQEAVAYLVHYGLVRQGLVDQGLQPLAGTDLERLAHQLESYEGLDETVAPVAEEEDDGDDDVRMDLGAGVPRKGTKGTLGSTRKALQALYELYLLASQKVPALANRLEPVLEDDPEGNNNNNNDSGVAPNPVSPSSSTLLQQHAANVMASSQQIERAIGLCEAVLDLDLAPREYVVKPEHSPRLAELAQELAQWQAELEQCHQDMNELWIDCAGLPPSSSNNNNNSMYVRLHIPDTKSNGEASYEYQFRLPNSNDSKKLQEHKTLKQHKVTVHRILKNGVYFSTPTLKQLASQREEIDREYDRHQRHVVAQAVSVASSYAPMIHGIRHSVAVLDAVAAMAQLAVFSPNNGYCRPTLTDSNDEGHGICLKQARHPCVERQENVDFIPNDIELTLGKKSCWLVTGPNMGGKSTFIRSVGAIVTLAQMGGYVPCESAQINLVHSISARVGAGDSQDRGISTFMSEMLEASAILQTAHRRSLIIVDELGRGTSTFDGYGLARAICEYIVEQIQCLTVFATHFHELTASLPAQFPAGQVHNCHVSAVTTDKDVIFLYQVQDGPCLDSFGIQVAEMAQVPPQAILDARAKLKALEATSSYNRDRHRSNGTSAAAATNNNKRPRGDGNTVEDGDKKNNNSNNQDEDDYEWLAKFQKVNIPDLLTGADGSTTMGSKDDDAIKRVLLQALQS
ncbi:hypothetical protein ACA910_004912 [Epithemia clementina (nom. ined.)]